MRFPVPAQLDLRFCFWIDDLDEHEATFGHATSGDALLSSAVHQSRSHQFRRLDETLHHNS